MKNLPLKTRWLIGTVLMFAGLVVSTIEIIMNQLDSVNWWMMGAALVLAGAGYAFHLIFVKCPECGARLPSTTKFPTECTACGADLSKYNK